MKRGLVTLDASGRADRLRAFQRHLGVDGLAAAAIYGDVHRSGDLTYLTNLCLYWNEGVLVVPADGEPVLLTKLSARVQPWMRETSTLRDVRSGPDLASLLAGLLQGRAPGVLGLVDRAWWPAPRRGGGRGRGRGPACTGRCRTRRSRGAGRRRSRPWPPRAPWRPP